MLSGHIALALASSLVILWIMFDAFELMDVFAPSLLANDVTCATSSAT